MLRLRLGARRFCSAAKLTALLPEATVSSAFHQGHRQFCLRVPSEAEDLATLLVAENNKVMHSATVQPGLPISVAAPLVAAALEEYDGKVHAFAALPGLCAWVAAMEPSALEDEFGEKAAGAAVAIALGRPRPGHSVLGQGTFRDAEPAWVALAGRYAETDEAEEAALYRTAGGVGVGVQHLATTEPAAMADYGGAMALFQFRE